MGSLLEAMLFDELRLLARAPIPTLLIVGGWCWVVVALALAAAATACEGAVSSDDGWTCVERERISSNDRLACWPVLGIPELPALAPSPRVDGAPGGRWPET